MLFHRILWLLACSIAVQGSWPLISANSKLALQHHRDTERSHPRQHQDVAATVIKCPQTLSTEAVEAEHAYHRQRQHLNKAIARMTKEDEESLMRNGWRLWNLFPPIQSCPSSEKIGRQFEDGGKFVCGVNTLLQRPNCTVFSFGSNGETSFEADILQRTACQVHTFDPTLDDAKRKNIAGVPGIHLHEYGLASQDGQQTILGIDAQIFTLGTILRKLDVHWVDLLKIDIEGSEWQALPQILASAKERLPFSQLQIELHLRPDTCSNVTAALETMVHLEAAGLRAFSSEYNFEWPFAESSSPTGLVEYSFVNIHDCAVVSPA